MMRSVSQAPLANRRRGLGTPALYAGLIILAFFTLIPFYWMVATALKEPQNVLTFPPQWVPIPAKFENFVTAWTVRPFGRWFANSIFIAAAATFLQLVTCSMAAYAFARLKFAGRDRLFLLYLGTLMIPGQVTLIPTFILIRLLDWSDTYQALILPPAFSAVSWAMPSMPRAIPLTTVKPSEARPRERSRAMRQPYSLALREPTMATALSSSAQNSPLT